MKKISVLFLGIVVCLQGLAQNSKVTSAKMHLDSYNSQQDSTELSAAKESIDEAAINDKTKDEPKMYLYRGEVYVTYFGVRLNGMVSKLVLAGNKDMAKVKSEAYTNMDTTAICIAANSFMKVLQLAPTDYYSQEAKESQNLPTCLVYLENKALREYDAERYSTALALYKKILAICSIQNISDTATIYKQNVEMTANSAENMGNSALALVYYQKLIDLKYDGATPYISLSNMYLAQKDSAKSWDYLEKGRTQYPDDINLIITETNFYIGKHEYEKAVSNLKLTIQKVEQSPDKDKNKNLLTRLYFNLGEIYNHKANPKDAKGNDLPKPADYDSLYARSDTCYSRALAIKPNDVDVLFSMGALYFNKAVYISQQANNLPLNATDKYNKLTEQAKGYFLQAQPYFEKAYKINPHDTYTANALMQVYANTGQNDKAAAMKSHK